MTAESTNATLHDEITRLLRSIEVSGQSVLVRYDKELLQSIVDAAAQLFGAAAASIALVDDTQQNLVFQVAYGAGAENVVGVSIPLDHGLAGYVVRTGQPISVRDVLRDARFNQDFATTTGYIPRSILATPLIVSDRTIGVMEVLDKITAPSFGMQDMSLVGLFARQAAIAIHLSQQLDHLERALVNGLRRLAGESSGSDLLGVLQQYETEGQEGSLREIAEEINAISSLGQAEQRACLEILRAFSCYARGKTARYPED